MGKIIQVKKEPKIKLTELKIPDAESGSSSDTDKAKDDTEKVSSKQGYFYPLVKINEKFFSVGEIKNFSIDTSGFFPMLNLSIETGSGKFTSVDFPKDGDIVEVFVRSMSDDLKPIRNNYEIIYINSPFSKDSEGKRMTFNLTGRLHVPKIHGENCKLFDGTSFDALSKLCDETDLGFASNIDSTDDEMNWLSVYVPYTETIQHIVKHAYKDENCFYAVFIDIYYCLNFVEVNELLEGKQDIEKGIIRNLFSEDYRLKEEKYDEKVKIYLSNYHDLADTNFYIQSFQLNNDAGLTVSKQGYTRVIQMYDNTLKEYHQIDIDPIYPDNSDSLTKDTLLPLRGKQGDDSYKKRKKFKWVGVQYSNPKGNVHKNFFYAQNSNAFNNDEIKKITFRTKSPHVNMNFRKYQIVPIIIFIRNEELRMMKFDKGNQNSNDIGLQVDKFLSGYYMVLSIEWKYNRDLFAFSQEIVFTRREWPKNNADNGNS